MAKNKGQAARSSEAIIVTNEEIARAAGALQVACGRRHRNAVVIFQLAKLANTLEATADAYQHATRALAKEYAQTDAEGEIRYQRTDQGAETSSFLLDPRRMDDHREKQRELDRVRNRIIGLRRISARKLLDGWKDGDDEEWDGAEPAIVMGLAPFLDMDLEGEEFVSPAAVQVERVEETEAA